MDAQLVKYFLDSPRSTGMSTTVELPDVDETCAYCGSRIFDHDPICVRDCDDVRVADVLLQLRVSLDLRGRK